MEQVTIKIDDRELNVPDFLSVRKAALKNGIYIPGLCSHPELDPFKSFSWSEAVWQGDKRIEHEGNPPLPPPAIAGGEGEDFPHCNLCLVSINGGEPQRACTTRVVDGMQVRTTGNDLLAARRDSLKKILANHPHACLTCAQKEGCARTDCSMNVAENERCCELLGRCEIGKVAEYIGIPADTPAYKPSGVPVIMDEPLFVRDYEICIGCMRCVRICRDVRGVDVLGAVLHEGNAYVGTIADPKLADAYCRFCGACVEVCPTGALRDHADLEPLIDGKAPCVAACPLNIDIPAYLELIAKGREFDALEVIRQRAVLPGVLGYACFHPCEDACRRTEINNAASICAVKRYASDLAGDKPAVINKLPDSRKRIAVIGGGPAGLAAAADLLRWGHSVTMFDKEEKLGGMLRYAIPRFRLPEEVIDRDLKYLFDLGLEIRTCSELGRNLDIDQLYSEGFDAVILAVGLSKAVSLGIEGEELEGVDAGLSLLRRAALGEFESMVDPVVVIGGGSVAVDTAMTARRLGASQVTMVCLEAPEEMPATDEELDNALEEGILLMHRWGVKAFDGEDGKISGVRLKRCTRVFDVQGNFDPEYDDSIGETIPAARIILSVGQCADEQVKPLLKAREGLFTAGDIITGASSIVNAMADGRRAAAEVDGYLSGTGHLKEEKPLYESSGKLDRDIDFAARSRVVPERIDPLERIRMTDVFESVLTSEQAHAEAERCLHCQLRAALLKSPLPPDPWHSLTPEILEKIPDAEGVVILADEEHKTLKIVGAMNINAILGELLNDGYEAALCRWELDPMYTKRESELLQAYLQAFGELPGSDDMDDLF
ncbi:FAD-dependent oxidoreductase [bacterium]|nr:FAD-dependent oxidoreductase [bacterium]